MSDHESAMRQNVNRYVTMLLLRKIPQLPIKDHESIVRDVKLSTTLT